MITALRKIDGRGELPGATSAVMELCVDNPREGFADLFATHPSVQSRVEALVKFAGGHDPGPLPPPTDETEPPEQESPPSPTAGPWNDSVKPADAAQGTAPSPAGTTWADPAASPTGPWGRH